jgi:hypothetical protein
MLSESAYLIFALYNNEYKKLDFFTASYFLALLFGCFLLLPYYLQSLSLFRSLHASL